MDFEQTFPLRVCMNLDRRPERWETAAAEFSRAGLDVRRRSAVDGKLVRNTHGYAWPSRYAVGLTKRLIVREARLRRAEAVFLFEDDVVLHPDWRQRLERLAVPDDWGMLMLGCQHTSRPVPVAPGLVRVTGAADNHAIGFRREWYDRVLYTLRHGREDARRWPDTASDRHISALMKEIPTYAPFPNLAWQREAVSDQTGTRYTLYGQDGVQIPSRKLLAGVEDVWLPPSGLSLPGNEPWMHEEERAFIRSVLRPDMTVLEYGAGGSTLHFPQFVRTWHSIEHTAAFSRRTRAAAAGNVHVHFVPPAWPQANPLHAAECGQFTDYCQTALRLGCEFDAVLVDGRARVDCALTAACAMKRGAWLFFHDYFARDRYLRRAPELQACFRLVREFRRTPQTMAVFRRR